MIVGSISLGERLHFILLRKKHTKRRTEAFEDERDETRLFLRAYLSLLKEKEMTPAQNRYFGILGAIVNILSKPRKLNYQRRLMRNASQGSHTMLTLRSEIF